MEATMMAARPAKVTSPKLKTKAGNDWLALDGVDNRSGFARRFKDVAEGLVRDLELTEADLSDSLKLQIRTAAQHVANIERLQAAIAAGRPADTLALVRMQNALARALWSLGLGKRKDLGPTEDPLDYAKRFLQEEPKGA
jgi:hypothetical protein